MKILHLSSEQKWRGGEQQIAYLVEESIRRGLECYIACRRDSEFQKYCISKNLKHISLGFSSEFDFKTAWEIKNFCNKNSIDILHLHSGRSHSLGVWSSILGNKAKLILSRRVDFPIKSNFFSQMKYNHSSIKKIICVSNAIEEIVKSGIKNPSIATTVYSGIDLERFSDAKNCNKLHREFNLSENTKIVANISAIAAHKDFYTFVDTAELVCKNYENIRFIIIGDGEERVNIEIYVNSKNLENKVLFTGFRNDISEIIKEIDVFLMTSVTEGLGTTILDAFANRVPVVATKGGGIPEAVIHNKTGLLANIKDSFTLSDYVNELLHNPDKCKELTENAYSHLCQNFLKQITAEKTIQIYNEILAI